MKKITRKLPSKLTWIIGILILAIAGYLVYDQALHAADRQKFMTLKADILALQEEFNQIDPGWEYSEACHAKGGKFQGEEASSCYVNLVLLKNIDRSKYEAVLLKSKMGDLRGEYAFNNDGDNVRSYDLSYTQNRNIQCGISIRTKSVSGDVRTLFGCHDSAIDFYFPKNQ